jgi:hypothetical protein
MTLNLILGAAQSALESCIVEGLQQIVESAGLKGFESVLIVSSNENHGRRHIPAKHFENVKSVALGHLNIQENEVRLRPAYLFERLKPRSGFSDDFNVKMAPQQNSQVRTGERLIVNNHGSHNGARFF